MKRTKFVEALGYVALYAAYVEESVDVVMEQLLLKYEITNTEKWSATQKIVWCIKKLKSIEGKDYSKLITHLGDAKSALIERHEVIHGRVYAGNDRSSILKSGWSDKPDREITADELYDLADELYELHVVIPLTSHSKH